ncbi:MAG: tRNA (N6-isopentenyl adenosine(37)-C2)-methylthiotransferase MiaB [Clostridiales bacterium]|nr:tRNA (N6-isopentenyl adenosine(37)-C2)-methylthiotransferase MiaB [Clostridiales bacterium]
MNKHDSERVAGMLTATGMSLAREPDEADLIVFMTCCVRDNADQRLYGQVASLKSSKSARPGQLIAVGGCIGQRDGKTLVDQLPHVDIVFGTHNIARLPALIESSRAALGPAVEIADSSDGATFDLPSRREHPWRAWVPITVGCDNFCSYCVVPYVRGRERSRTLEEIVAECEVLVANGVSVVTLLGQNVNSYGRDVYGRPRFADALRAVADTGVRRIHFATSHPKDLSDETIAAMAETPAVARYLHLPVQSGSDRVLSAMNRHYTAVEYVDLTERLRAAMPDLALSTDIIVGFPGESDEDFEMTMDLLDRVGFDQAFTFIFSPREGTPAATMPGQLPREITQPRFERLVSAIHTSVQAKNRALLGTEHEVLFDGASKRDETMLTGRTAGNKVVHVPLPEGAAASDFAGRFFQVHIDEAQTWFLGGYIKTV